VLTLAEDLDDGRIDVDPEYQREVVWTGKSDHEVASPILNLTVTSS
jgi:hypothetical protein